MSGKPEYFQKQNKTKKLGRRLDEPPFFHSQRGPASVYKLAAYIVPAEIREPKPGGAASIFLPPILPTLLRLPFQPFVFTSDRTR